MKPLILSITFLFFVFLNVIPYIYGAHHTPPNHVYLGTVHYGPDYLYYIAQVIVGKENFFLGKYLFSVDPVPPLITYWPYVVLGRIGHIFRIQPIPMYHIGLFIAGLYYLYSAWWLTGVVFTTSWFKRYLTIWLFMLSNTMPRILFEPTGVLLAPHYSWYNFGEPFIRFSSVPHHLLISALVMNMYTLQLTYKQKASNSLVFLAGLIGIFLSSMQPIQWALTVIVLGIYSGISSLITSIKHRIPLSNVPITLLRGVLPISIFALAGLPCVMVIRHLLNVEPFITAGKWEAAQSPQYSFRQLIDYFGPIFSLGSIGLVLLWWKKRRGSLLLAFGVSCTLGLLLIPAVRSIPVLTIRYLSAVHFLAFSLGTVEVLSLLHQTKFSLLKLVSGAVVTLLLLTLGALTYMQFQLKLFKDPNNYFVYLPRDVYQIFLKAREISTSQDNFLVYWPYDPIFPAIAGRKEYLITGTDVPGSREKSARAYNFLLQTLSDEEQQSFLQENSIDYIISQRLALGDTHPLISPIFSSERLTIYKVK